MTGARIGLIGLGTMGAMLALNIAEKGFTVAVWNRTAEKTDALMAGAGALAARIVPTKALRDFVAAIAQPRAILLMVPAGPAVDEQIAALRPLLEKDDLIIDAGNANFHDTSRRAAEPASASVPFLGIGVSGGEEGARHGPSIMGGGPRAAWDRVAPILEAISAKYGDTPCAAWMGEGGAGHLVKSVHNGIEYADMQLIAEIYGILRDGAGLAPAEIGAVFRSWNERTLKSYLIEISAAVAMATDSRTGRPMLEVILDRAEQKGTGRWTVIEAQKVAAPVPVIEAAVAARNMSADLATRQAGAARFAAPLRSSDDAVPSLATLEAALIASKIMCYAQGFALLSAVGSANGWTLPMPAIARVWREGCIIRSAMLNDMADALTEDAARNLMFAPYFADLIAGSVPGLRETVAVAARHGLPVPALYAALGYFDTMRTARGTANMIQGQRDFFGAHGFERVDERGVAHHGSWGFHAH